MTVTLDELTELRIPSTHGEPSDCWDFLVVLVLGGDWAAPRLRPDRDEAVMLSSFISYLRSRYDSGAQDRMLGEAFDIDPSLTPYVFRKRGDGDWAYRRPHWTIGPFWSPDREYKMGLTRLLDKMESGGAAWDAWKSAHPEVFGAEDAQP